MDPNDFVAEVRLAGLEEVALETMPVRATLIRYASGFMEGGHLSGIDEHLRYDLEKVQPLPAAYLWGARLSTRTGRYHIRVAVNWYSWPQNKPDVIVGCAYYSVRMLAGLK